MKITIFNLLFKRIFQFNRLKDPVYYLLSFFEAGRIIGIHALIFIYLLYVYDMKPLYSLLLKSAAALLILLFQLPVFGEDYFSIKDDGNFDDKNTWSTSSSKPIPSGSPIDYMSGKSNFYIRNGHTIKVPADLEIKINTLKIEGITNGTITTNLIFLGDATFTLTGDIFITEAVVHLGTDNVTFEVIGDLNLENGTLNFGTGISSVTVQKNLIGKTGSINQSAAKIQQLILNGASNDVKSYTSDGAGVNEVVYSGTTQQNIFGSLKYSTLTILGTGASMNKKVLSGAIKVSTSLTIADTYVQLDINSLEYSGKEQDLHATTGWVDTNNRGQYINSNPDDATKSFPVGDAGAMRKVKLSNISSPSDTIAMSFPYNSTIKPPLTSTGMGPWRIFPYAEITFNAEIYPGPGNADILTTSKIAFYNVKSIWEVKSTTYSVSDKSYSTSAILSVEKQNTFLALYNCPDYNITPASIPNGYVNVDYTSPQFVVTQNNSSANSTIYPKIKLPNTLPPNFSYSSLDGFLKSTTPNTKPEKIEFIFEYKDQNSCSVSKDYTLLITSLPSPNLSILPIDAKTFDSDSFRVRTYSRSAGNITYSIATNGGCAKINPTTGFVTILPCGSPPTTNLYTVTATQATDGKTYKGETVSKSFIINPAPGRLYVKNFAFLLNSPPSPIKTATKSIGAAIKFEQLSGFNEATLNENTGYITPTQTGQFTIHISLAATNNYTAFDSVYTFNVYTLNKPPVAVSDTIVLEMGKDTTFNILLNDRGQTGEIIPKNTDIDIDNRGLQIKYYATELGNFTIDTTGNLTVRPFYGFIGSGRLGYTVNDGNGLSSEIAYVEVTIKPPFVIPELKANDIMTPNNDNLNDALVIANTDLNKENSLIIMDGTGNRVYDKTNYQNDWEGISLKDKNLEAGIYFYIFKETYSGRELKNYIQIVR